jgi:hypothetical protein
MRRPPPNATPPRGVGSTQALIRTRGRKSGDGGRSNPAPSFSSLVTCGASPGSLLSSVCRFSAQGRASQPRIHKKRCSGRHSPFTDEGERATMQDHLRTSFLAHGYTEVLIVRLSHCASDWRAMRPVGDEQCACPRCGESVTAKILGHGFTRRRDFPPFEQTAWPLRFRDFDPAPMFRRKRRHHPDFRHRKLQTCWE